MFHLVQSTPYSPSYFHNTFLPKMIVFNPGKSLLALFLAGGLLAGFVPKFVVGQCNCPSDQCCSKYGYCGLGNDYCGDGCQAGPCNAPPATNTVSVADVVTDAFFNGIVNKATGDCPGKGFFTRATFLDAVGSFAEFGRVGSVDDSKREIAAFFAHVTLETGFLCKKEEDNRDTYCDTNYPQYPCNPNKQYYGRGPLQLTWNYNYAKAGSSIGFDGLGAPETVANDAIVSFKASLWYWMQECHSIIISGKGFGETIRAINGNVECNKGVPQTVQNRVAYYQDYCSQFGVSPGDNLTC